MIFSYRPLLILLFISTSLMGRIFAFAENSMASHALIEELRQEIAELRKSILIYSDIRSNTDSHILEKKEEILFSIEDLRVKLEGLAQGEEITDVERRIFRSFNQAIILASQVVAVKDGWWNYKEIRLFNKNFLPSFIFYYDGIYVEEFQRINAIFAHPKRQENVECVVQLRKTFGMHHEKKILDFCKEINPIDLVEEEEIPSHDDPSSVSPDSFQHLEERESPDDNQEMNQEMAPSPSSDGRTETIPNFYNRGAIPKNGPPSPSMNNQGMTFKQAKGSEYSINPVHP